jgi:uncharacterized protein YkwD
MHRLALLVVSFMLALGTFAWISPATVVTAQDGGYAPDGEEAAFVDLLNGYRGSIGLAPVSLNYELGAAAEYHSLDMATNNYFDHYLFDGTDPGTNITNFGYTGFPYSENIAAGMASAQEVLIAWQNSPEHNATMTNGQFTEVGVGRYYVEGSNYGWYWTATYGAGEGVEAAPAPIAEPAPITEPAPIVEPAPIEEPVVDPILDPASLTGSVETSESTTTYEEPPTVITNDGGVVELQQNAVNADGDRAVSTGANPVADGTGETIIYGDINTGGIQGESVVYEPPSLNVTGDTAAPAPAPAGEPVYTEPVATEPVYSEPAPSEPVYTDPTFTETTTTNISMDDGNGRAIG